MSRAIWQIAGGSGTRSHADLFLKYGVGLIGPGDAGVWKPERDDTDFQGGFVRRFASEVKIADIILLRTGVSSIVAVGVVASDYLYLNQFDDVDGWDLQHGRRIRWYKLPEEYAFSNHAFGARPPRFSQIGNEEVVSFAERFISSPPTQWQNALLPGLPPEEPPLEDIPRYLKEIATTASDLLPLFQDPQVFGEPPSEDELIVHLIVPFFRSLGWPPELIAVKWRSVDVAIFKSLPRTSENCRFVVEAKRFGSGLEGAWKQAKGYVEGLGISADIIVADGARYRMYDAQSGFQPIAYANLARLKRSATNLFTKIKRPTKEIRDAGTMV